MKRYIATIGIVVLALASTGQTRFPPNGGGVTVGADNTWTGTNQFDDEGFLVCDDGDDTKCAEFETSGITGSTTRTLTVPDTSGTLLTTTIPASTTITTPGIVSHTAGAITWSWGVATAGVRMHDNTHLQLGTNADTRLSHETSNTPDSTVFGVDAASRSIHVAEVADEGFDWTNGPGGTSATTAPHITWHSENQDTTNYSGVAYYGTAGKWVTTLTESSATAILTVPVADNTSVAGTIKAKTFASDGTDHQARYAELKYVAVNEGGTETCTLSGSNQTDDGNINAITSGTLTYAWTCTTGTNTVTINLNAISSLTQTTLSFEGRVDHIGAGEPLPQ